MNSRITSPVLDDLITETVRTLCSSVLRITQRDIDRSMVDDGFAREISQHQVCSAFRNLPLADDLMGVSGQTPSEALHVLYLGIFSGITVAVHDILGSKTKNAKYKDRLDMLHQRVTIDIKRNSLRPPATQNRFGWLDGTRLRGDERMGGLNIFNICLHTDQGKELFTPFLTRRGISLKSVIHVIELLLSYDAWMKSPTIDRQDLIDSMAVVREITISLTECLPRKRVSAGDQVQDSDEEYGPLRPKKRCNRSRKPKKHNIVIEGSNGWSTVKFHEMRKFPPNMSRFGSARNFDGGQGEFNLKETVKKHGNNTSRVQSTFTKQVGDRYNEAVLINEVHEMLDRSKALPTASKEIEDEHKMLFGEYTCEMTWEGENLVHCNTLWRDLNKRVDKSNYQLHRLLTHGVVEHCKNHGVTGGVSILGYTELRIPATTDDRDKSVIYRCCPNYRGLPWYDWAKLRLPEGQSDSFHIGRIYGFIRFLSGGVPTPYLMETCGHEREAVIEEGMSDHSYYTIVDVSTTDFVESEAKRTMVSHFEINPSDEGIRLLPINRIIAPVTVVTNYKADSSYQYLLCLDRKEWKNIFAQRIQHHRLKSSPSDVDSQSPSSTFDDDSIEGTSDED